MHLLDLVARSLLDLVSQIGNNFGSHILVGAYIMPFKYASGAPALNEEDITEVFLGIIDRALFRVGTPVCSLHQEVGLFLTWPLQRISSLEGLNFCLRFGSETSRRESRRALQERGQEQRDRYLTKHHDLVADAVGFFSVIQRNIMRKAAAGSNHLFDVFGIKRNQKEAVQRRKNGNASRH